jgi:hypothetical protein
MTSVARSAQVLRSAGPARSGSARRTRWTSWPVGTVTFGRPLENWAPVCFRLEPSPTRGWWLLRHDPNLTSVPSRPSPTTTRPSADASHAAFLSAGAARRPQPDTSTDESAQSRTLDQAMTIGGAGTTAWPTWSPQSHAPCSENHRQAGAACFGSCWVEASPSARQPRGFASPDAPGPGGSSRPCRRGAEVQNVGLDPRPSGDPQGQIHGPGDLR